MILTCHPGLIVGFCIDDADITDIKLEYECALCEKIGIRAYLDKYKKLYDRSDKDRQGLLEYLTITEQTKQSITDVQLLKENLTSAKKLKSYDKTQPLTDKQRRRLKDKPKEQDEDDDRPKYYRR